MNSKEDRIGDGCRGREGHWGSILFFCAIIVSVMILGSPAVGIAGQHCGAEGDWRNILIPDVWPPPETQKRFSSVLGDVKTVPVYNACIRHDNCYGTSGAKRDACDKQFLENMKTECDRVYNGVLDIPLREACRLAAKGYYQAVQKHGRQAFQKAQDEIRKPVVNVSSGQSSGKQPDGKSAAVAKTVTASGVASARAESSGTPTVSGPVFFNSDFENGDLTNWTPTGDAFQYQPTKGDNPTARNRNQPSGHQGDFWIGSFEKYQGGPDGKPGSRQGDKPTGTLCSIPFEITGARIGFLIGGGSKIADLSVVLMVDSREVRRATGQNSETMKRIIWDVDEFQGETAQIIIQDGSSAGWGHINADDFRFM